eukprot:scaffold648040_cov30-Prasinocladus_malaysianus.AAC.1
MSLGLTTLVKEHSDKNFLMQSMRGVPASERSGSPAVSGGSISAGSGVSSLDFAGSEGPRSSIGTP